MNVDLNLRQAVLSNMKTNDPEQMEDTIADAIQNGEEKMLPGLGVLFELIWKQSGEEERQDMINSLEQGVNEASD